MTNSPIEISDSIQMNYTVLPNDFIDGAMCTADGEYVKIYLMILRRLGSGLPVTPDILANRLNLTQKDILRAVSYWEKVGLLKPFSHPNSGDKTRTNSPDLLSGKSGQPDRERTSMERSIGTSSESADGSEPEENSSMDLHEGISVPGKVTLTPLEIEESKNETYLGRIIFMAETYLERSFSHNELNSLCYISDQLAFSTELMEYLIEYCVERGKKSIHYIERVAIEWYRKGITTVAQAKEESDKYVNHVFPVMKALGLSGRSPAPAELEYIKHWIQLGLSSDLIIEACNRTLLSVHQPSFQYANSIIEDWHKNGVHSIKDVENLDRLHQEKASKKKQEFKKADSSPKASNSKNSFHNFDQRDYDYQKLEEMLLSHKRK